MSTLDDCLELVSKGTVAFAAGVLGFFYLSDHATTVHKWLRVIFESLSKQQPNKTFVQYSVSKVVVRCGTYIDRITFHFTAGTLSYGGGSGGNVSSPFVVDNGEKIVQVRGVRGAYLEQVQFVTDRGRESPVYGRSHVGEKFTMYNADGIGGLDVLVSINGWLRSIRSVIPVDEVVVSAEAPPQHVVGDGIVRLHQRKVRKRLRVMHLGVIMYACFLIFAMWRFVGGLIIGPTLIGVFETEPCSPLVFMPSNSIVIDEEFVVMDDKTTARWIILELDHQKTILVRELHVPEPGGVLRESNGVLRGVIRKIDPGLHKIPSRLQSQFNGREWLWSYPEPEFFVDDAFSPLVFYMFSVVVVGALCYTVRTEFKQTMGIRDPVTSRFSIQNKSPVEIAAIIDEEILASNSLVIPWSSNLIAVTETWLIKTNYFGIDAIAISDAKLVDLRVCGRWIMGELIEIVALRIESKRSVASSGNHRGRATYFFDIVLPRMHFDLLSASLVERVNRFQDIQVQQRERMYLPEFETMLSLRSTLGNNFSANHTSECLGACGRPALCLVSKTCTTCEERDLCNCDASWCHECILKWWFTKNATKVEMLSISDPVDSAWQARCPTCRVYFCLNDLVPRKDIAEYFCSSKTIDG